MATIDNLNKSISDMDADELRELLRKHRLSRRTPKARAKATKTSGLGKQVKKEVSTDALVEKMTPEKRAALIAELEDELSDD